MTERKHGRICYNRGCDLGSDCEARKVEAREYQRKHRAELAERRGQLGKLRSVPTSGKGGPAGRPVKLAVAPAPPEMPTLAPYMPQPERPIGAVGLAVKAEIAAMPDAGRQYPGFVALALSLADLVDNGDPLQRVQAAREIRTMMSEMRPEIKVSSEPSARDKLIASLSKAL